MSRPLSPPSTVEVVVHQMTMASERALLLDLRPLDQRCALPPFESGAHIDIHLGALVRQYSLVNGSHESHRYLICVQHETAGRGGSAAVHRSLRVGDRVQVSAPRNTFPLEGATHHAVLLGAGIGITPLLGMAEHLAVAGKSFELHCYATSEQTLPLRRYLDERGFLTQTTFHYSGAGDSLRSGPPAYLAEPQPDTVLYVCGPAGFIDAVRAFAEEAGWPERAVRFERFAAVAPVERTGDSFAVVASSTGQSMQVDEGETIAEVLERNGYEVSLSCEQGICGSCILSVLAGIPDHRDEVQTAAEHAANDQINICCSRSLTSVLELHI